MSFGTLFHRLLWRALGKSRPECHTHSPWDREDALLRTVPPDAQKRGVSRSLMPDSPSPRESPVAPIRAPRSRPGRGQTGTRLCSFEVVLGGPARRPWSELGQCLRGSVQRRGGQEGGARAQRGQPSVQGIVRGPTKPRPPPRGQTRDALRRGGVQLLHICREAEEGARVPKGRGTHPHPSPEPHPPRSGNLSPNDDLSP